MAYDKIVVVKVIELVLCLGCLIYMIVTDYESRQVFYRLEKYNREWPLLNSVTWEENGFIFTHAVFGSYVIITIGLLIGYLCGELKHGRKMEKYFLGFGVILFVIAGSLIYASLDSVPPHLVKNAAILGTLALLTALLFILDIGLSRPKPPQIERFFKSTQTEFPTNSIDLLDKVHRVHNGDSVIGELRSSLKSRRRPEDDFSFPKDENSIPDLTTHLNGLDHSIRSRDSPDERAAPQSYLHNGDIHSRTSNNNRKLSQRFEASESFPQQVRPFPPDIKINKKRIIHERPDTQHKQISQEREQIQHITREKEREMLDTSVRDKRTTESQYFQRHRSKNEGNSNSNSSSGDQRYLEQSEISKRPESITPEERYRKRPGIYPESDSEVDDIMRVPTVSFLLTEKGELMQVHPSREQHSLKTKVPQGRKRSIRDTELSSLTSTIATLKNIKGSLKARSSDDINDETKNKYPNEELASPARILGEREKERYIFGDGPELSSNRSLDIEAGRIKRFEEISHTPSPDKAHWDYDRYNVKFLQTERQLDSSPSDPRFVRYTAHDRPDSTSRTTSPQLADSTKVKDTRMQNWPLSHPRTPSQSPHTGSESAVHSPSSSQLVEWPSHQSSDEDDYAMASPSQIPPKPPFPEHIQEQTVLKSQIGKKKQSDDEKEIEKEDSDVPSGGSLTTQLLHKWFKQRKTKVEKSKSNT